MFRLKVTGLNQGTARSLAFERGFKLAVAKALSLEARRIVDDANQIAPFIQASYNKLPPSNLPSLLAISSLSRLAIPNKAA